ncbi:BT_2262 family domain-containing protein [Saccharicrinis sp. GN24d3]|uniref:BT_2262 family domain-containing protein n=1 Tax=Saccharicrinis sp. GN24d3 TaxID=3458416 RepID=UPI00403722E1
MKKILFYLFSLALIFQGCEKNVSTEDTSRITYYANLDLLGSTDYILEVGGTYNEPGYEADINGVDVSGDVVVTGTVDVSTAGYYPLTYSVANEDGYEKTASRNVFVLPAGLSATDASGVFTGLRVGRTEVASGCTITKLAEGFYYASDFFGGYYEFIAGYGSAYRLPTYFVINADNTLEALTNSSPWGPWPVKEGLFNPATGGFTYQVWNGTFHFDVVLTKE